MEGEVDADGARAVARDMELDVVGLLETDLHVSPLESSGHVFLLTDSFSAMCTETVTCELHHSISAICYLIYTFKDASDG